MAVKLVLITLAVGALAVEAMKQQETTTANPIRKVVTMIQKIQAKVEAEGVKEKELFDKYMCYCKNSGGTLDSSIASANTKIPQLGSDIEAAESQKAQLQEDLKAHRTDRDAAKSAMADATALREKEAAEFASEKDEAEANIAALTKATAAVEKGMAGFLQTDAANVLRKLIQKQDMADTDRDDVLAFFSDKQGSEYSPSGGQITGILKTLQDEMSASLAEATTAENAAIAAI